MRIILIASGTIVNYYPESFRNPIDSVWPTRYRVLMHAAAELENRDTLRTNSRKSAAPISFSSGIGAGSADLLPVSRQPSLAWSCGGGTQSVAIGVLIAEGRLPVPDFAAIVDTGRERRTTWDYLANVLNPYLLANRGFQVEIVPHTFKRVDLYDNNGTTLIPAYSTTGRLSPFCSGEWKRDPMKRWLRSKGVKQCVQWLGFSLDESRRATGKAHKKWTQPAYPLIELRLTRHNCEQLILRAGLPLPDKSRCWCCPHQNREEWAQTLSDPIDGPLAIALDSEIRESDQAQDLYLHSSRVPLALANVHADESTDLFQHCQDGGCYT